MFVFELMKFKTECITMGFMLYGFKGFIKIVNISDQVIFLWFNLFLAAKPGYGIVGGSCLS